MNSCRIYGLLGYPVKHSLSPLMHNAAFKNLKEQGKIDYDAEYRLFEVPPERLEEFLLEPNAKFEDTEGNSFAAGDVLGFNITIPHKVRAKEILESKFPPSELEKILNYVRLSGAVNTVKRKADATLEYTNTDYKGFSKSLKEDLKFNTKDKNILLMGCGGAGRTVVAGLVWKNPHPKKIFVYEPSRSAKESAKTHFNHFSILKEKIQFISKKQIQEVIKKCQLLVNASPVGAKEDNGSLIDKDLLHKNLYVYDVVYNRQTQLIKDAKLLGCPYSDGLGMLLYQGAAAFELWTGKEASLEIMRMALNEGMKKV